MILPDAKLTESLIFKQCSSPSKQFAEDGRARSAATICFLLSRHNEMSENWVAWSLMMVQYSAHDISCFYLSKCSKFVKHNLDDLSLLHRFSRIVDHTSTNIIKSSNKLLNRFIRHVQTVGKFCCKLALHYRPFGIVFLPNWIPCSSHISNLTVGTLWPHAAIVRVIPF